MSEPEQRVVFDEVASLYDRARPGYPAELAADVIELSGLRPGDRILEVGCGTGQATRRFAGKGYRLTCLEPGPAMARIAREKFAAQPDLEILETTFEDWPLEEEAFALLISAQSFHWVRPGVRYAKAARALAKNGAMAVFWNVPEMGDAPVHRAIQEQYAKHAPELGVLLPGQPRLAAERPWYVPGAPDPTPDEEIQGSGLFGPVHQARYPWQARYDAEHYEALMRTQSNHRLLPETRLGALLSGIHSAIRAHGGAVSVEYEARLYFARRG